MNIADLFDTMPQRYRKGSVESATTYYFSVGDHKYTVFIDRDACRVERGKAVDQADVVLKTTAELFEQMVVRGKMPAAMDVMRGRVKTNDPGRLHKLREMFDFTPR